MSYLLIETYESDGTPSENIVFAIEKTPENHRFLKKIFDLQSEMGAMTPKELDLLNARVAPTNPPKNFGLRKLSGTTSAALFRDAGEGYLFTDGAIALEEEAPALIFTPKITARLVAGMLTIRSRFNQAEYETTHLDKTVLSGWK